MDQRENKGIKESLAHLDPKDQPVLLVRLEIKDQDTRESPGQQAPKVTWEYTDRKEILVLTERMGLRERGVNLETRAHPGSKVSLALLEWKVPRVHLERKAPKEMELHFQ